MSSEFQVEILTPAKEVITTSASEVLLPTFRGEIGILPMHEDICGLLSTGTLKLVSNNKDYWFMISGGAFKVVSGVLTVLAEYALGADNVEIENSQARLKEIEAEIGTNANILDEKISLLLSEKQRLTASLEANRRHTMS